MSVLKKEVCVKKKRKRRRKKGVQDKKESNRGFPLLGFEINKGKSSLLKGKK